VTAGWCNIDLGGRPWSGGNEGQAGGNEEAVRESRGGGASEKGERREEKSRKGKGTYDGRNKWVVWVGVLDQVVYSHDHCLSVYPPRYTLIPISHMKHRGDWKKSYPGSFSNWVSTDQSSGYRDRFYH
jgi:hypothetical protein